MQKLQSIQVLRGLAALGVVVCHATDFPLGAGGVDIFFVISGFIISQVMVGRAAVDFAKDRARRIYPIYWIMAAPWLIAAATAGILPLDRLVSTITLWPIVGGYARPVLIPAWTLCYEMLFYAAVTVGLATRRWRLILAAFAVAFAAQFVTSSSLLAFVGNPMILEFLLGVAVARAPSDSRVGAALACLAIIAFAFSPARSFYDMPVQSAGLFAFRRFLWWGLPAAGVVYCALAFERPVRWPNALVYLGDASYSLYLVHIAVLAPIESIHPVTKIALAVAAGIAAHELLERRLLRWRRPQVRVPNFGWLAIVRDRCASVKRG